MKLSEIKLNVLEVRNFDRVAGYVGRARKAMRDWVTQYIYISEENLTTEEFEKVLEGQSVYGQIRYFKTLLTFSNGCKLYKHVCEAISY